MVRFVSGMADASFETIDQYQALLARLPPNLDLAELARETKAFLRPRGVRSPQDLLRLILAWAVGGFSLQRVAAWAGEQGIADLTDEALVQRLHRSAEFVQAVANAILKSNAQRPGWPGRVLRIADSSSLSKQASRGTDWRLHAVYDLARGGFTHLELTDGHGGEALDRGARSPAKSASATAVSPTPRPGGVTAKLVKIGPISPTGPISLYACAGTPSAWLISKANCLI